MTHGKVRRGLSFWVFGWALLVVFPPLGLLWLLGWGVWVMLKVAEDRASRPKKPTYATPEQQARVWVAPEAGIYRIGPSVSHLDPTPMDWVRVNNQAAYAARLRHAEETGQIQ